MINKMKLILYTGYGRIFKKGNHNKVLIGIARVLQRSLGFAVINFKGINLLVGPLGSLDRGILSSKTSNQILYNLITHFIKPGDVYLDIGAHFGEYSLHAALRGATSYAFEPSKREILRLYKNILLNNQTNVIVYPFGVSEKTEEVMFQIADPLNPGMNSVHKNDIAYVTSEKDRFYPLTSLITTETIQKTKLCKIDVEGYELFVLKGIGPDFHNFKNTIFVLEMSRLQFSNAGYTLDDIYTFFKSKGFDFLYGELPNEYDDVFFHSDVYKKNDLAEYLGKYKKNTW